MLMSGDFPAYGSSEEGHFQSLVFKIHSKIYLPSISGKVKKKCMTISKSDTAFAILITSAINHQHLSSAGVPKIKQATNDGDNNKPQKVHLLLDLLRIL
ncbi:hypothetical protein BTVI_82624 [Pitangus sulphuratus]|nr:hypothetical protein BTVI_82624 [Pitangus sulphuratus]